MPYRNDLFGPVNVAVFLKLDQYQMVGSSNGQMEAKSTASGIDRYVVGR